jgi:hypothetical protein
MRGIKQEREKSRLGRGCRLIDLIIPSREQIWGLLLVLAGVIALIFSLPE